MLTDYSSNAVMFTSNGYFRRLLQHDGQPLSIGNKLNTLIRDNILMIFLY